MTGFCPVLEGTLEESVCRFDGYCSECPHNEKGARQIGEEKDESKINDNDM